MACSLELAPWINTAITERYEEVSVTPGAVLASTVPEFFARDIDQTMPNLRRVLWAQSGSNVIQIRQTSAQPNGDIELPFAVTPDAWFSCQKPVVRGSTTADWLIWSRPPLGASYTRVARLNYVVSADARFVAAAVSPNGARGCFALSLVRENARILRLFHFIQNANESWSQTEFDSFHVSAVRAGSFRITDAGQISFAFATERQTWWYYYASPESAGRILWETMRRTFIWHTFVNDQVLYGGEGLTLVWPPMRFDGMRVETAGLPSRPYASATASADGTLFLVYQRGADNHTAVVSPHCSLQLDMGAAGVSPLSTAVGAVFRPQTTVNVARGFLTQLGVRARHIARRRKAYRAEKRRDRVQH